MAGFVIVASSFIYGAIESSKLSLCEWVSSDRSSIAASRAAIYLSLSSLYLIPANREHVLLLQNASSSDLFNIGGSSDLSRLETDLGHLTDDVEEHLSSTERHNRLSVEWTKLFRGVKPEYSPLPPYESLYRGGWLDGSLEAEVRDEYLESGFDLSDQWAGEPQDHIGLELGYMSFLSGMEAEAWAEADTEKAHYLLNLERSFLQKHPAVWINQLLEEVKQYDETGFYLQVAELTETWIGFDSALIAKHAQCRAAV